MDEDESSDDEGASDDSGDVVMGAGGRHGRKEPSVIIEDITDQEVGEGGGCCVCWGASPMPLRMCVKVLHGLVFVLVLG